MIADEINVILEMIKENLGAEDVRLKFLFEKLAEEINVLRLENHNLLNKIQAHMIQDKLKERKS